MALMKFREPNQVKWMGSRPGHDGTHVAISKGATNASVELYEVPAGKVFYLCHASMGFSAVAAGRANLFINTNIPALWFICFYDVVLAASDPATHDAAYWPPIEIPAAYKLYIHSNAVGLTIWGQIHGWVE